MKAKSLVLQSLFCGLPKQACNSSQIMFRGYESWYRYLSSSCSGTECETETVVTQSDINRINLLIPRLCISSSQDTNNTNKDKDLATAIHLVTTALLAANPPTNSLSLSPLIHTFTSLPDMSKPISLLTLLYHSPVAHRHLLLITAMLISSYIRKRRPKEALKVYNWMLRPNSPFRIPVSKSVYGVLVGGLCELGFVREALRVLRDMVLVAGFVPGARLRDRVYRSLLRDARVGDALALDESLRNCFDAESSDESVMNVADLLESVVANWIT